MSYSVVLTGTIDTSVYNNTGNIIKDIKDRKNQYYGSIERYIKESVFTKIVFIENSDFNFDVEYFNNLAKSNNKEFEFIKGKVCKDEIILHGKSFGDAYLINEALQKSQLLKDEKEVFKITGRIFLINSKNVVKNSEKYRNQFIVYETKKWCLTNIFKCNIEDYKRYFNDVFLDCDEKSGWDIERCIYCRLQKSNLNVGRFNSYPFFEGRQGANGKLYTQPGIDYYLRNCLLKLNFFTLNSKSQFILKYLFKIYYKIIHKY